VPKWLKIILILAGIGVVLLGAIIGGFAWWISANKDRLAADGKVAQDEGTQFGKSHTQAECVDEGLSHLKQCGAMDFMCEAMNKLRLTSCMDVATKDTTCREAPSRDDIFKMATWSNQFCADKGWAGSQQCGRLAQSIPEACAHLR